MQAINESLPSVVLHRHKNDRHLKRHLWRVLSFHEALIYITNRKLPKLGKGMRGVYCEAAC